MYAESKVKWRLDIAQQEYGFKMQYHAPEDVDSFEKKLISEGKYLYDDVGKPYATTNLSPADSEFILNEQVLAQCDAAYWLTRYCMLKSEENVIMRFKFRVPQKIYFDILCDLEEREAAIEIMILKARQLGMSIFTELLISQRTIMSYGVNAVVGSADQTKTDEMSRMLYLCYDMLPIWIRPQHTSRVQSARGKMLFGHMASG